MIAYFPHPYPDELLYSHLSRFHVHSGSAFYQQTAAQLFRSKQSRVSEEFINDYMEDALLRLTAIKPFPMWILENTMLPAYSAFLPEMERNALFLALVEQDVTRFRRLYHGRQTSATRYLKICPICITEDRKLYGEAYWHRIHQLPSITACPVHSCSLLPSSHQISGRCSPSFFTTEEAVQSLPLSATTPSTNDFLFSKFISETFHQLSCPDMRSDEYYAETIRAVLPAKYSTDKEIKGALLLRDINEFFERDVFGSLNNLQRTLYGTRRNIDEVCALAVFCGLTPLDLIIEDH